VALNYQPATHQRRGVSMIARSVCWHEKHLLWKRPIVSTIACLGWGSLIWNPQNLPLIGGWRYDGPPLPVEFTRKSSDGRVTLVITRDTSSINVLWCHLAVRALDEAKAALATRERISSKNIHSNIGFWSASVSSDHSESDVIGAWASSARHAAVVWTALPSKFPGVVGKPSCEHIICYLKGLEGDPRSAAEEYVRLAPMQIRTRYRDAIERELGWTPTARQNSPT
jgi:hypothetical protein